MGIPYGLIGIGIGFLLGIWAFIVADSVRGRVFIGATMIVIFFLPGVWRSSASEVVSLLCWIIFGVGCFIFLKLKGIGI